MTKKLFAMILSLTLCLSLAACGDSDDSSKTSKNDSQSASAEGDTEKDDAKDDESKADTASADETPADDAKDDDSKTDTASADEAPADDSKDDESKAEEFVPEGKGEWAEGTGYKVFLGENWVNFDAYKSIVEEQIKEMGKDQFNLDSNINMEVCFYYNDGDFTDGAPCFNILKPTQNAMFSTVSIKDLEEQLNSQVKTQYQAIAGASVECNGIVKLGGVDALEYITTATVGETTLKARQYYLFCGSYMYTVTFSIPDDQYDGLKEDMDNILRSLTFTEA